MRKVSLLICITAVQLFGLYTILVGVIGEKKIVDKEITPVPKYVLNSFGGYYSSSVNKIVIFVIDAFRVDFLFRGSMPFVTKTLDESNGCVYVTLVKAPTVTLPRIKALVSGDISTYWDFLHNFKSAEMTQDNFIWQAYDHSKHLVFYGDDTWLKLFPTHFRRKEGVSSFYVSDFTEVDNNVTRNLRNELSPWKYWDLMVLHYLGLDHIGHVHGPQSILVPSKLEEMDKLIEDIYTYLKHEKGRSMIIICGDHGMANVGGHGGNTYPEVTTPLVFLSTEPMRRCANPEWRENFTIVDQTQVAPTLSALWGLPLPAQSIGQIIPAVLGHLSVKDQLLALHYNALHLKKVLSKLVDISRYTKLLSQFDEVTMIHATYLNEEIFEEENHLFEMYRSLFKDLSSACGAAVGEQNTPQLISGIVLLFQAFVMSHLELRESGWTQPVICSTVGMIFSGIAFWFQLDWALPLVVVIISVLYFAFGWKRFIIPGLIPKSDSVLSRIVHTFHYTTPLIYFSSSLVEEEHYFRYYVWSSLFLLFIVCFSGDENKQVGLGDVCVVIFFGLVAHRIAIAWNQTGQKWSHLEDFVDTLKSSHLLSPIIFLGSFAGLYKLRSAEMSRTFPGCLILTILLKFDSGILNYVSFGYVSSFAKFGYIIPALEGFSAWKTGFDIRTGLVNAWILVTIFMQRQCNFSLVFLILVQVKVVSWLCDKFVNLPTRAVIFLWLSFSAFFYQGNSNSIASIDVNSGYFGLEEYNEVVVGFLIFVNTFSVPVLVFLCYLASARSNRQGVAYDSDIVTETYLDALVRTNGLNAVVYSIVILVFRDHLFIWSVFVPKLLYLYAYTVLSLCIVSIYALTTYRLPESPTHRPG